MPGVDLHSYMVALRDFVVNWWPLLGLTFYCVLLYIFWRMLQLMPRVKPATVMVDPRTAIEWADIAGADEAKAELLEIVEFLRDPKRFEELGAVVPKGVLLYGPPGTGKTLLARAAANESGAKFYAQSASAFVEMFAGLGAARIRKLFAEARKHAPSIIFIDELDAVGAARSGHSFNREQDQTLNQLLVELDGFSTGAQVVVMGASNRLQDLDPALLRPGRFDRQLLVAPPDRKGREAILHVHTRRKPLSSDVQLDLIARQTSGLTGADLANIANEAAILAGRREAKYVTALDFDNALERVVAGLQQKKVLTDKERRILAYHEAGHALMSHLMGEVGHLQKVTIVSRGTALGYTLHLPNEDRYMESKEELIDMLKIALAGRAAEQVVFGRVTNGAASDLEKATEIARAMVFEWGMSDIVTSRTLRADNYALSEETKRVRDSEQAHLTDGAYAEAVRLIEKHRSSLDRLTQALLEKETLMREEVLLLLADVEPESRASETVGTPRVVVSLPAEA
jgi:cell division protease FtsH